MTGGVAPPPRAWPHHWLAAVLGLLFAPVAMLYVGAPRWAAGYLSLMVGAAFASYASGGGAAVDGALSVLSLCVAIGGAVQAYRRAGRIAPNDRRPRSSRWPAIAASCAVLGLCGVAIRGFAVEPFRNASDSMFPAFPKGAQLVAHKWGYGRYDAYGIRLLHTTPWKTPQRGQVVVFAYPLDPATRYVKRLVGVPGDLLEYRDKTLRINGVAAAVRTAGRSTGPSGEAVELVEEVLDGRHYVTAIRPDRPGAAAFDPHGASDRDGCATLSDGIRCTLPAGRYFVLGDHRDASADSRLFGTVPEDHLIGVVDDPRD